MTWLKTKMILTALGGLLFATGLLAGFGKDTALVAKTSDLNPPPNFQKPIEPIVRTEVRLVPVSTPKQTSPTPIKVAGSDFFARLRQCESGGNYATNTGNGYYGAYQYDRSTWNNYGGYSTADQAPPSVQDEKARQDYARRGGSPWPTCSRR